MSYGQNASQTNLWVGSLPSEWTDAELREKFSPFGNVQSVKVLTDHSGTSKGCGFVNLSTAEEAQAAMEGLATSGLLVKIATDPKSKGGGKGGGGKAGPEPKKDNLYVMGLPVDCTPQQISDIFKSFNIMRSKIMPRPEGREEMHAMVQLSSEQEAQTAMEQLNGNPVEGIELPKGALVINFVNKPPGQQATPVVAPVRPAVTKATGPMSLTVRYGGTEQEKGASLYILGLPTPQIDESTLKMLFTSRGFNVTRSKVLPASENHDSSAALVRLGSAEEAESAIATMNGLKTTCEEVRAAAGVGEENVNVLTVNYAGYDQTPSNNIFISGLPSPKVDQSFLQEVLEGLGLTMSSMKCLPDTKGVGHSQALVRLESEEQAATAIAMLNGEHFPADKNAKSVLEVKYGGDGERSANIFIKGLPAPQVSMRSLKEVFAALELTVVRGKQIPDTKGFGASCALVELGSPEEADKAIELLDGEVCCDEFKPDTGEDKQIPPIKANYAGMDNSPSDNVYLANLPSPGTTEVTLKALITSLGFNYKRSKLIPDTKGWGACAAMVQVGSQDEAAAIIENLSGQSLTNKDMLDLVPAGTVTAPVAVAAPTKYVKPGVTDGKATVAVRYAGSGNPGDNLYMAGLPVEVNEVQIRALFAGMGMTVQKTKLIPDTKGYGCCAAMVQVGSLDQAAKAIELLHGESFTVEDFLQLGAVGTAAPAPTPAPAPARAPAASGSALVVRYGGNAEAASDNLFIGNLPKSVDEEMLKQLFVAMSVTVQRLKILPDIKNTGYVSAMVKVGDEYEAAQAIEQLNGEVFPEEMIGGSPAAVPMEVTPVADPPSSNGGTHQSWNNWNNGGSKNWNTGSNTASNNWNNGAQGDSLKLVYAGKQQTPSANLYISNLPSDESTDTALKTIFEGNGMTVARSKVNPDTKGWGKTTAMLQVASEEEAANAIEWFTGKTLEELLTALSTGAEQPPAQEEPPAKKAKTEPAPMIKVVSSVKAAPKAEPWPTSNGEAALTARYAGKKGADGKAPPSDYVVLTGFAGELPSEDEIKAILVGFNVNFKRMRNANKQLMIQVGSIEEAGKTIANLDGWPWPSIEEPWPEC